MQLRRENSFTNIRLIIPFIHCSLLSMKTVAPRAKFVLKIFSYSWCYGERIVSRSHCGWICYAQSQQLFPIFLRTLSRWYFWKPKSSWCFFNFEISPDNNLPSNCSLMTNCIDFFYFKIENLENVLNIFWKLKDTNTGFIFSTLRTILNPLC